MRKSVNMKQRGSLIRMGTEKNLTSQKYDPARNFYQEQSDMVINPLSQALGGNKHKESICNG